MSFTDFSGTTCGGYVKQFPWPREADSIALQASVENMDAASQNFFHNITVGKKVGFPKFKAKHHSRTAYRTRQNIKISDKAVHLPKLGWVKAKVSISVQGRILNATVSSSKSGEYLVSLCCTGVEILQHEGTGAAVGIDVGIKDPRTPLNSSVPKLAARLSDAHVTTSFPQIEGASGPPRVNILPYQVLQF